MNDLRIVIERWVRTAGGANPAEVARAAGDELARLLEDRNSRFPDGEPIHLPPLRIELDVEGSDAAEPRRLGHAIARAIADELAAGAHR